MVVTGFRIAARRAAFSVALTVAIQAGAADFPIEGRAILVKTGKVFKVTARGTFTLPNVAVNDPLSQRTAVELRDSSLIPALAGFYSPTNAWTFQNGDGSGTWVGLGAPSGSKGYRWRGGPSAECRSILIKPNVIKAVCKGAAVTAGEPVFVGEAQVIISIGDPKPDPDRYCLSFGGTTAASEPGLLRRKRASAPPACPSCNQSGYPTCGGTCPAGEVCQPIRTSAGIVRDCSCGTPPDPCGCSGIFFAGFTCPPGQVCSFSGVTTCGSGSCVDEPIL